MYMYACLGDTIWTWKEWAQRLESSFKEKFFVTNECEDKYVNRKGIIKDW